MSKKIRFLVPFFVSVLLVLTVFEGVSESQLVQPAETLLPRTTREMQTAGFWVNRLPGADQVILDESTITRLNETLREMGLTRDLLQTPQQYSGEELRDTLKRGWRKIKTDNLYRHDGQSPNAFLDETFKKLNLSSIPPQIPVRYGLIVHYADQRLLPTSEGLYAKPGDLDFDELQNSALDLGTPIVVLHESADGQWLYVFSELSDGWMRKELVALCDRNAFEAYLNKPFVVTTEARADVYLDPKMKKHYDHVRMGAPLPQAEAQEDPLFWAVLVPSRGPDGHLRLQNGYIPKSQADRGYRLYTARTILEQAFKLLHHPYGWGGMYGGQDCSRFLQEVFATVGLKIPRNSKEQQNAGKVHRFDPEISDQAKKNFLLRDAVPGYTLLGLKGHIMLYVGSLNGEPYAIHAVWAYRQPSVDGERTFVINRVAVSDLNLGEGSQKGSLLQRIISMNFLTLSE